MTEPPGFLTQMLGNMGHFAFGMGLVEARTGEILSERHSGILIELPDFLLA
jgi:hypothetical protein